MLGSDAGQSPIIDVTVYDYDYDYDYDYTILELQLRLGTTTTTTTTTNEKESWLEAWTALIETLQTQACYWTHRGDDLAMATCKSDTWA